MQAEKAELTIVDFDELLKEGKQNFIASLCSTLNKDEKYKAVLAWEAEKMTAMPEGQALTQALQDSLLVLSTTSPDKRSQFEKVLAGANLSFTHSGKLDVVLPKTPEKSGTYKDNAGEKNLQQQTTFGLSATQELIYSQLGEQDKTRKIVGMTEDSGWQISFEGADANKKRDFIIAVKKIVKDKIRSRDHNWLANIDPVGGDFPGANLKPLQESLGGFHELMNVIYEAVEKAEITELRYTRTSKISFAVTETNTIYEKKFESGGRLLNKTEYDAKILSDPFLIVNADAIQVPDGQRGEAKAMHVLLQDILTKSSEEVPAHHVRRDIAEFLKQTLGTKEATPNTQFSVGWLSPDAYTASNRNVPSNDELHFTRLPTQQALMQNPNIKPFGDADVVVLAAAKREKTDNNLHGDPNFALVLNTIVLAETDPKSMNTPIILDNRNGAFDEVLEIIKNAFIQGRAMGDLPFLVAKTSEDMENYLLNVQKIKGFAPTILHAQAEEETVQLPAAIPNDGVFTVFIAGGHANNNKKDMQDAFDLGYLCAKEGWRIVTGAGAVHGSMGSVHTGFIQYHLDNLEERAEHLGISIPIKISAKLNQYKNFSDGKYDAETIIEKNPQIINKLADLANAEGKTLIPRDKFYGYSTDSLLKIESEDGNPPPGITYGETGNLPRRLDRLLQASTVVILSGSVGTDQELDEAVYKHDMKRSASNDECFADGMPGNEGMIIVDNRNKKLGKLLHHYGLQLDDPETDLRKSANGIAVIQPGDEPNKMEAILKERAKVVETFWRKRIEQQEVPQKIAI